MDKSGYEAALRMLVAQQMDVYVVHILSPEEVDPDVKGDLRLIDCEDFDEAAFSNACLALGRQYELQRHIESSASVSKLLFQNATKLADNRGLLEGGGELIEERRAFADEVADAVRRVDGIAALARSRQAGLIQ